MWITIVKIVASIFVYLVNTFYLYVKYIIMENLFKKIMVEAGYDFTETNRSYFCKAVNNCLNGGKITIEVCQKGNVWVNKITGNNYNLRIKGANWTSKIYLKPDVYTSGILRHIGYFLQIPQVKEKIMSEVSLHTHCSRCGGVGYIPQFNYYCDGICFECYGTGRTTERDLVLVKSNV